MFGALIYSYIGQRPGYEENRSGNIWRALKCSWCWRRMEKIKWSEKVTNEKFLNVGYKREEETSK